MILIKQCTHIFAHKSLIIISFILKEMINNWNNILPHYSRIKCKSNPWMLHDFLKKNYTTLPYIIINLFEFEFINFSFEVGFVISGCYVLWCSVDETAVDVH